MDHPLCSSRLKRRALRSTRRAQETDESTPNRSRFGGRFQGDRGDVVEAVILTPLLLLMVFMVIQGALIFHARSVVTAAAQDATRAAQLENSTGAAGQAAGAQILAGSSNLLINERITVNRGADEVTTVVEAEVTSLVPLWSPTVRATVTGPVERFRPENER